MSRKLNGQDAPKSPPVLQALNKTASRIHMTHWKTIIDATTMDIHYNKHAAAYAKIFASCTLAESVDMKEPLEKLLAVISRYSVKMRNNARTFQS